MRRARRVSDKIRKRIVGDQAFEDPNEEGIAVVPIYEKSLTSGSHLVRRTAR